MADNSNLKRFQLPVISIGGDLQVESNHAVTEIDLPLVQEVNNMVFSENSGLEAIGRSASQGVEALNDLPALRTISGSVLFQDNSGQEQYSHVCLRSFEHSMLRARFICC